MAFGFFKKNIAADLILKNGVIITQNAEMPEAEALACKDGKIIAVGSEESIEALEDSHTHVIDLCGGRALPGLVFLEGNPVMDAFKGKYLDLDGLDAVDELLASIRQWASLHDDKDMVFGFGYSEELLGERSPSELAGLIDSACEDKPVVLLCRDNISCAVNSAAMEIITATAEEEMVRYITTPYVLNLFVPFDFEEIEAAVVSQMEANASLGITSVLSLGAPDYFSSLYQDALISIYNEASLKQRFFNSYMLNRPLQPRGLVHRLMGLRTNCNELDGLINADMLFLDLDESKCPMEFSEQSVSLIMEEVSDRGFDIYIRAAGQGDLIKAFKAAEHVRSKGYKNSISIESTCSLPRSVAKELIWPESIHLLPFADAEKKAQEAPYITGSADRLGVLEAGRLADIAVFEKNSEKAVITIFNGNIVYQ